MRLFRRRPPEPPKNVRLLYPDGTVVPVECVYDGRDRDGIHVWRIVLPEAIRPYYLAGGRFAVSIDELPARTTVAFPVAHG